MDAPETSVNRIGRTIWTVWGYLSGAVAKYLRPEVTDEGNQRVCSRSDEIDLSAANKIKREVKANSSEKEENKSNRNDKSTGEVKCFPAEVKVQVASVQWENTDVVKDDKNDELHVDTARKQTYHCAWSAEAGHEGDISGDSESRGCKSGMRVEKEAVSSDEGPAERVHAHRKDSEIVQELDETGGIELKDGNDEECDQNKDEKCDQNHEDEKCSKKREDPDNADVIQSELYGQDVKQGKQINMMDHGEAECSGGFRHAGFIDEMEKKTVGLSDQVETEIDEDRGPELQVPADAFVLAVQDLPPELEYSAEETDGLSKPERLKVMEKFSDEIAEFCENEVEEMIPENRGATESEPDTIQSELRESAETLQRVSQEKTILNIETELKMTSVLNEFFETVNTPEDSLQLDSKQDTPENTSETGTGLPVVAIKTGGMFSKPIVCEFPGESGKRPETGLGCFEEIKTESKVSVEHPETPKAVEEAVEIEQDIESPIESLGATESQTHQEIDDTKFSLKKHVELKTELIIETTEIKISSEDEEAEPFETQSQSSNIRNVTLQTHELLEFTERECKSSQETMDTFCESLGNASVPEITGTAEIQHVAEDQTDAKPILPRSLSPVEFLEETLDLQSESERCVEELETLDTDVVKTALEYVEGITNQVLKEMIEMDNNLVKETETLEGLSTEELGDAEYQGPGGCVSVGAFVLEEERKLLSEAMGSIIEAEITSREVAKQNEQDIISQECETTEADQQTYLCAGTDHGGSSSCDTESDVENEEVSSNEGQTERVHAHSECKESETPLEVHKPGQIEQKDDNDEKCDQNHEDEKCEMKSEDSDNAEVIVQSELYGQDVELEKQINMMDHGEAECSGGFRHAGFIDEMEKKTVGLSDQVETEIDEDRGPELQVPADAFVLAVQDLPPELEYSAEETDGLSKPERLKVMEKYSDEIGEFCENEVEEMIPENRGATESEPDTIQSELRESAETLQRVSQEKTILNIETELKMTSVLDEFFETVNTPEDSLQLDSKQDTPKNTSETGTGLPVVAIKTGGMFSKPIVCEFPGESGKRPETGLGCFEEIKTESKVSVEHPETPKAVEEAVEIEQDIESPIESLGATESQTHQEIDDTKFSLKKHVELKTELIIETTEIKISSEDEEAEPFETQSQSSNIRNVTLQTHELLEFTERECKSSQETMDTFCESLGNASVPEITGTAEIQHVAEDQTDAKPILARPLSPAEFLEETLDLQSESERCVEELETLDTDVVKTALEYVEGITNQVLKEMIEMDNNLVKETETLEGLSTEELGDAEYQGPGGCVSVGAFVLEEERKLLSEAMGSIMEAEITSREVAKQNEQDIISQECETTEADQQTYLCAGTDHGGSCSCDTESDVENEEVSSNEGQTERVHAHSECKESETPLEVDKPGQIEQKDDNDEECDQKHEDEKCEMKSEDSDNAEVIVQSELYRQDVELEKQINMMDHGETESSGGFRHLIDEKETNIVDQNDHEKAEIEEDQGPELHVPADAFVLDEGSELFSETVEVENASREVVNQIELQSSPECGTNEADGRHEQIQNAIAGETESSGHEDFMEISRPGTKRGFDEVSKDLPVVKIEGEFDLDLQAFEDSSLDFTVQKSRIAVKNPLVRPPKDPRKLLYMISVEPRLPRPPPREVSLPSKGGVGFKLPGLGAGLPALRKTEFGKKAREEGEAERTLHPQQKSVAVTEDSVKQEQASAKPKWTPPKLPGMGSPLMMAELRNKLKKPVNE
ncbi:hypothetical protein R3I94_020038 [Phoxinus phoxinus]